MSGGGYLLWVAGTKGPEPQKCHEFPLDLNGKVKPYLSKYDVTAEQLKLSLNELAKMFPAPEVMP